MPDSSFVLFVLGTAQGRCHFPETATSKTKIIAIYQSIEGEAAKVVGKSWILIFPQLLRGTRHDSGKQKNSKSCEMEIIKNDTKMFFFDEGEFLGSTYTRKSRFALKLKKGVSCKMHYSCR